MNRLPQFFSRPYAPLALGVLFAAALAGAYLLHFVLPLWAAALVTALAAVVFVGAIIIMTQIVNGWREVILFVIGAGAVVIVAILLAATFPPPTPANPADRDRLVQLFLLGSVFVYLVLGLINRRGGF